MLQISTSYRELEKKYGALASMMSNQSQLISRLEKLCQATKNTTPPPQVGGALYLSNHRHCYHGPFSSTDPDP